MVGWVEVGFGDLRGLFQPKGFCYSKAWTEFSGEGDPDLRCSRGAKQRRRFQWGEANLLCELLGDIEETTECCPSRPGQQPKFPLLDVGTQGSFLFHF